MTLRSFLRIKLLTLLITTVVTGFGQDNTGPSICECVKYAKNDPQLLSRCDQRYDYNRMTSYERYAFEQKVVACTSPEVCDCVERSEKDPVLKVVCDSLFDPDQMSEAELTEYDRDKEGCYIAPERPDLKTLCDCVNGTAESESSCTDIWNISHLTHEERQLFVDDITACLAHEDDPDFTLSVCDCLSAEEDDYELKERCIRKFDLKTLSAQDIEQLKADMGDCDYIGGDEIEQICKCLRDERETGEMSGPCVKLLGQLEQKYATKSPEEMQAFIERLMECLLAAPE